MKKLFLFALFTALATGAFSQIPTTGLVGYWPFNGNANDESGHGHNGTVYGATPTLSRFGGCNGAYHFDGNDSISVLDAPELNISPGGQISVSVWVKRATGALVGHFFGKRQLCDTFQYQMGYVLPSYGVGWGGNPEANFYLQNIISDFPQNAWIHFVGTYNGTQYKLYKNDTLRGTKSAGVQISVHNNLLFGTAGTCQPFEGDIDDIRMYNRELSAAEVHQLFLENCTISEPTGINQTICTGTSATLTATGGTNFNWYADSVGCNLLCVGNTYTTPVLTATDTFYVANNNGTCESSRDRVIVTVSSLPSSPTGNTSYSYCQNEAATQLAATGANLLWYDVPSGGTGNGTAPTPGTTTPGTTHFYVSQTVSGCEGPRLDIAVTVIALPAAPTGTASYSYCEGETATQLAATGTNLLWYTVPTGGTGSTTAPLPSTLTAGVTHYYVSQTAGGCESPRLDITVEVIPLPSAPTGTDSYTYCVGEIATQLTVTGTNLLWYNVPTGGTGSSTAPTPLSSTPGVTHFYASQTVDGCEGPRLDIVVTVNSVDISVTVNDPSLTAIASPATYQWMFCPSYNIISGQTLQNFTALANGYYACIVTQNGCIDTTDCYPIATVGIVENIGFEDISITPNPTTDRVSIKWTTSIFDMVVVYDFAGKQILRKEINGNVIIVDLEAYPVGIYNVVMIGENTAIFKVMRK